MFEEAKEAMEQAMASPQSAAPEANQSSSAPTTESSAYAPQETEQQATSTVHDLEKLGKFTFGGKEYTPQELKNAMMRQDDYTRKTQELAQERKYSENLTIDLRAVRDNPALVEQFKKVYPEKYHSELDLVLNNLQRGQPQTQVTKDEQSPLEKDPRYQQFKSEYDEWKEFQTKEQQKQAEKTIDNIMETMATKFKVTPEMRKTVERIVIYDANSAFQNNLPMTNDTWEKIYSNAFKELTGVAKSYSQSLITKQQTSGKEARDAGQGGQAPGQAPKRMTFKEATDAAVKEMSGR